jgi:hypothetical protein
MRSIETRHNLITRKRQRAVQTFEQLRPRIGNQQAASAVGTAFGTLWRWKKAFDVRGLDGLRPRNQNSGRRSAVAGVDIPAESAQELERLKMELGGDHRTWRAFLRSPHCPPAMAQCGLKTLPAPLARLVKLIPLQARCYASADGRRIIVKLGREGMPR